MRRSLLILAAAAALVLSSCGRDGAAAPSSETFVTGVVTAVDAVSLTDVRGFTVRAPDGTSYEFKLGLLENATTFSPSHLKEHQATSEPVRVWYRIENGDRVAYRIEDAPG